MRAFATASRAAAGPKRRAGDRRPWSGRAPARRTRRRPVDRGDDPVRPETGKLDRPPTIVHETPPGRSSGSRPPQTDRRALGRAGRAAFPDRRGAEADHQMCHGRRRPPTRQADRGAARWRLSPRRRRRRARPPRFGVPPGEPLHRHRRKHRRIGERRGEAGTPARRAGRDVLANHIESVKASRAARITVNTSI